MASYIIRRLIQFVFVFLLASITVFFAIRLLPGDPILVIMTPEEMGRVTDEQLGVLRHEYGLDRPMLVQYVGWLSDVLHGDLGVSLIYRTSVTSEILKRLPITLHLGLLAIISSGILGTLLGVLSAVRRGRWLDTVVTITANLGITVPSFWLAILLVYIFAIYFRILPVCGYTSPFNNLTMSTRQLIMPVFCLAVFPLATVARQTRSSMLEVMGQDYIRTALSKGLKERIVITRHALKNAFIPVVTLTGILFRNVLGGAVIIETVFNIPGLGRLAVSGIITHDYAFVQGVVLVMVSAVLLINLAIDLSYGWLDPRVRYD
ncbi:MAG: ABC transporter permease [Deltaproteobacteria bacterium]|nr:MAG: ABC transporter permease [Deltaproteobacteria bacterium]